MAASLLFSIRIRRRMSRVMVWGFLGRRGALLAELAAVAFVLAFGWLAGSSSTVPPSPLVRGALRLAGLGAAACCSVLARASWACTFWSMRATAGRI